MVTACEQLENRLLFVTTSFDGTAGPDNISLEVSALTISVTINGSTDTRSDVLFNTVEINGLGGNDTISIHSTGNNSVLVNCGAGADAVRVTPFSQDLDDIFDSITVNGDAESDTLTLFDNNQSSGVSFTVNGTDVTRQGVPTMTANVENLVVNGGLGADAFNVVAPAAASTSTFIGNGGSDTLVIDGPSGSVGTYTPSGTTLASGSFLYSARLVNFSETEFVEAANFTTLTLRTPNADDVLTVTGGASDNVADGTSGGFAMSSLRFAGCDTFNIDAATNDAGVGNDSVTLSGNLLGASVLGFNSGTGTNTLSNTGNYTVDTDLGATSGTNLNVVANGNHLTFSGAQNLKRLEIDNGGTVSFLGSGSMMTTQQLAVVAGNPGTIDLALGQTATAPVGATFSIAAGRTLIKKGAGTLGIAATQSHGAGATLNVTGGTFSTTTDAGSAVSRTLTVDTASGGIVVFSSNEHLAAVFADVGTISMAANGTHVLVTNAVGVGSEGGAINLNNNDMIVDYTGASQLQAVQQLITSGYAGGAWNGIGIDSATAAATGTTGLGYAEATDLLNVFPASFSGQLVDSTAVLVKYTWYGDANLDGQVDVTDLGRLATNWQNKGRWIHGDSNYDQRVDVSDLGLLATNWQSGVGSPLGRTTICSHATGSTVGDDLLTARSD